MKQWIAFFISVLSLSALSLNGGHKKIEDLCDLEILTPSFQTRKTAKIRLDNGLEVYAVSDPQAEQSAAALCMEVGSWNDPKEFPGMAHFLEHLLFMGSKTYPEENGYSKRIQDNQGIYNASTSFTHTIYMFSVNNDAFLTTLDMFSHMFSDPLLSFSGVERELHAIDQEHDKNVENDFVRRWMVLKETGNPNHPNAHFNTGNMQTLQGIPQEEVRNWYETHYSANRAHLVLYSSLSIEEIKAHALSLFAQFPQSKAPCPPPCRETVFSKDQEGHWIAIDPHQEQRTLFLQWELPQDCAKDLSHSVRCLLRRILQRKYPSSLYDQLKGEGLINDIGCGTTHIGKETAFFWIGFDLTPKGAKEFEQVIERSFQTLNFLKTSELPPYLFDEMQTMIKTNYQFQSRIHPFAFVKTCARELLYEPLETYPSKTIFPATYCPKEVQTFLSDLTPEKGVYLLIAPSALTNLAPNKKEQWTGAPYTIEEIPSKTLKKWSALPPHPNISFPEKNPFIPEDLCLMTPLNQKEASLFPTPTKFLTDQGMFYFWEDTQYQLPKISWVLNVYTPLINNASPYQKVLCDLFCRALNDRLAPILSFAESASLQLRCIPFNAGLSIELYGYSKKAMTLLSEGLELLKECPVTQEAFDLYRAALKTEYATVAKISPLAQAFEIHRTLLFGTYPKQSEKLAALETLTYDDYLFFATHLFDQYYIRGFLGGNMTEKEAHEISKKIEETLKGDPYPPKNHPRVRPFILHPSEGPFKICAKTESLGNAACLMIQEGPPTFKKAASHLMLTTVLREDFFNTLRTKQQTGYIVGVKEGLENQKELHHLFFVQSSTHQPEELLARFELFLEPYVKEFEKNFSEERFECIKTNLITRYKTPPTNLRQMAKKLHQLAFNYGGDFAIIEKLIAALKELSYQDLKTETASFFSKKNSKRVAILVEGTQLEGKEFRYAPTTEEALSPFRKGPIPN